MRKRLVSAFLALILLLLCGCTGESGQDTTGETTTALPGESTAGSTAALDYSRNVEELASQRIGDYDGSPTIQHDPDRKIYVYVPEFDKDLYEYDGSLRFWVYSQEQLEPEQIQLRVDCQTEYTLQYHGDYSEYCRVKETDAQQLYSLSLWEYQYYCLLGADWQELGALKAHAWAAFELRQQHNGDPNISQVYQKIYNEYQAAYEEETAEYHRKFEGLAEKDIPQFYLYFFEIVFSGLGDYEETVKSAELSVGGETYPMNLGQLRLHTALPQLLVDNQNRVGLRNFMVEKNGFDSLVPSGYQKVTGLFSFDAEKALTITGIRQLTDGTEMEILAVGIRIKGQPDYFWDMQRPIEVEAGVHVDIDLYLKDTRLAWYAPNIEIYFLMDYETGRNAYTYPVSTRFDRSVNMWDIYLMAFEGVDTGAYFAYMEAPYINDWLKDLPEDPLE